jgi:tRNA (cytidine32/uridine32-2'-O)-methyltransferase
MHDRMTKILSKENPPADTSGGISPAAEAARNIRIVLANTTHPGNIGGTARAMKNMCLANLWLVAPKIFPSSEADVRASGARDVLQAARQVENFDEALADCRLVVGTTARSRAVGWPQLSPRECARLLVARAADEPVALVFGRESSGLTNEQVERCHYLVSIPSNETYSSLNLVCAVQVLSYEIMLALLAGESGQVEEPSSPATSVENMRRFYRHLEQVLDEIKFIDPKQPRLTMRKLVRLFNRAAPSDEEMNILRGILTAMQRSRRPDA